MEALAEGPNGEVLSASFAGLFRTEDGGGTWQAVGPEGVSYLSLLAHSDGTLLAGTFSRGVLRSEDGGRTWTASGDRPVGTVLSLAEMGDGAILAGTSGGVIRSEDGGATWTVLHGLGHVNALHTEGDLILAGSRFGGAVRSADRGRTWESLAGRFPPLPGAFVDHFSSDGRGGLLAAIDNVLYRSADDGMTWSPSSWSPTDRIADITTAGTGRLYLAAEDGVWISDDGGETRHLVGLRPLPVATAAETGRGLMAGAWSPPLSGTLYWRNQSEGGWHPGAWLRDMLPRDALPVGTEALLLATTSLEEPSLGGAYRSEDGGLTWQLTALHSRGVFCLAADGSGRVYAGTGPGQWSMGADDLAGVYRSLDGGRSWTEITGDLRGSPGMEVRGILADADGVLYARTEDPELGPGLFRSDGSGKWSAIHPTSATVSAVTSWEGRTLFVGTPSGRVHRSEDRGDTWTEVAPVSDGVPVTALAAWRLTLWAGTEIGLYFSGDEGSTWQRVTEVPVGAAVTFLKPWDPAGSLLAGTEGHGIFRTR